MVDEGTDMIGQRRCLVVDNGIFGTRAKPRAYFAGPSLQVGQYRSSGGFVPPAACHFSDDPRAVAALRCLRAGFYGNTIPGGGKRCRPDLALDVFPLGEPLALADDDLGTGRQRLRCGLLEERADDFAFQFTFLQPPKHLIPFLVFLRLIRLSVPFVKDASR